MPTVKFDDYLKELLESDDKFKEEFLQGKLNLESAAAVYEARIEAGLSQRELARKAKIPQSTISRVERGENTNIATVAKIAKALNGSLRITIQQ